MRQGHLRGCRRAWSCDLAPSPWMGSSTPPIQPSQVEKIKSCKVDSAACSTPHWHMAKVVIVGGSLVAHYQFYSESLIAQAYVLSLLAHISPSGYLIDQEYHYAVHTSYLSNNLSALLLPSWGVSGKRDLNPFSSVVL
jgi:hypothetical protein